MSMSDTRAGHSVPMRVLVVDDEAPIRRLLQHWVEGEGATVVQAGTAEEGLAIVDADPPAVALCDIRLPGRNGLWLAEQLKAQHPDTAVVMTTGVNEFDAAVNSLQAGVVDYLVKPFVRERMVEALQRAFFAHKSRCALAAMDRELTRRRSQITEALAEIEMNSSASLEAMLSMLRARDARSVDHARRVATLAVNLAMTLQIGEPRLSDIERAALLHDLGRLALPDALLNCDERSLSAGDRARFRAHPQHAHAMLKNVPILAAAAEIAVAAHERCDGSGFPHGLEGDAIPRGATIVGLASAYTALVAGESPITPSAALERLTGPRAAEFDPEVLEALRTLSPGDAPSETGPDLQSAPRGV